jgi:hypothetical protein
MNADAMVCQVLRTISRDKVERARLVSEYKSATDVQSKIVQARRVERAEVTKELLDLLKSGKSVEEIMKMYEDEN